MPACTVPNSVISSSLREGNVYPIRSFDNTKASDIRITSLDAASCTICYEILSGDYYPSGIGAEKDVKLFHSDTEYCVLSPDVLMLFTARGGVFNTPVEATAQIQINNYSDYTSTLYRTYEVNRASSANVNISKTYNYTSAGYAQSATVTAGIWHTTAPDGGQLVFQNSDGYNYVGPTMYGWSFLTWKNLPLDNYRYLYVRKTNYNKSTQTSSYGRVAVSYGKDLATTDHTSGDAGLRAYNATDYQNTRFPYARGPYTDFVFDINAPSNRDNNDLTLSYDYNSNDSYQFLIYGDIFLSNSLFYPNALVEGWEN